LELLLYFRTEGVEKRDRVDAAWCGLCVQLDRSWCMRTLHEPVL
jgi:hypothetical protein